MWDERVNCSYRIELIAFDGFGRMRKRVVRVGRGVIVSHGLCGGL